MWWVVGIGAAVILAVAYLAWTAARVDRLHARVAAATQALEAHLLRRAAAAAVLAEERLAAELYAAARLAIDAEPWDREAAENDLTRQLRQTELGEGDPAAEAVVSASRRLALARQVHTDLVRDTLSARRRPLVRLLGRSRRHERPSYFDVDDPTLNPQHAPTAPELGASDGDAARDGAHPAAGGGMDRAAGGDAHRAAGGGLRPVSAAGGPSGAAAAPESRPPEV